MAALAERLGRAFGRHPITCWSGLVVVVLAALAAGAVATCDDTLRAYPSPERHDGVRELAQSAPAPDARVAAEDEPRDFDGDGHADRVAVEYFHMEPLLRRSTSGMVCVTSGRTGGVLLAHAVPTPLTRVRWCGDLDGNGTEDLVIEELQGDVVLGFVGAR